MIKSTPRALALVALTALPLLAGCGGPGLIVDAANATMERRSMSEVTEDSGIKSSINAKLLEEDTGKWWDTAINVHQGRVMLTGVVENYATKAQIGRIAKSVSGVKMVYNDLVVSTRDAGFESSVDDAAIEAAIKGELVSTKGVTSVDYDWNSVRGTVYIIGLAGSATEARQVKTIISRIKDVRRVVSHITY